MADRTQTAAILFVQNALGVPPTGVYDERTTQAVKAFQKAEGLELDPRYEKPGEVGPCTWKALTER